MKYCDLTFPTPEENLACDEALLELGDRTPTDGLLRLWEPEGYFVVLGYANAAGTEANLPYCQDNAVPVLRRCTGGGTVLQGPGVLNYSLIFPISSGPFESITGTNKFILERHQSALAAWLRAPVELSGQTDLAIGGLKFSGNAQRRRQRALLFHGSFLLHLDLAQVEKALPMPSRQPDYRLNRSHSDFLLNLNTPADALKETLLKAWNAETAFADVPLGRVANLAAEKYALDEWNFRC
jgi:lipoate-protein ligase A